MLLARAEATNYALCFESSQGTLDQFVTPRGAPELERAIWNRRDSVLHGSRQRGLLIGKCARLIRSFKEPQIEATNHNPASLSVTAGVAIP
jgi:hypothetical protein